MKILIVYDTKFGNTEKVAQAVKLGLENNNDITMLKATEALTIDATDYELIILGSPTNGGRPSPATQAFINSIPAGSLKGRKAAVFDTGSTSEGEGFITKTAIKIFGYAAPRMAIMLEEKGAKVVSNITFFVKGMEGPVIDGELERTKKWAKTLLN